MKRFVLLFAGLFAALQFGWAEQPTLRYNKNGKFKIVQFTDVHYIHGDPRSDVALECIREVVDAEKPDLVFFTGDVIYGKPAEEGLRHVLKLVADKKIPFAVVFGNHDDEQGLNRQQLFEIIRTVPYNLTATVEGLSGVTNFILPVKSSDGKKDAHILYGFDSQSYSKLKGIGGYDYIQFDQIQWYRENSARYTQENKGTPIPSLAFFHIPLPEYNQAANDETAVLYGTRKEKACAPQLNSGLFASMREMGDVQATFVGHDHDDDYAVYWKGILLCYGRYTGGNTVYNNLKPNGARVIELTEGEEGFHSWIRLPQNEIIHKFHFPTYFQKKKE
ncbi:metallophosphatase [Parabacteroides sp. 52]|uniref:metallophosphoesterase family protein n=1 Tax=unclassified Parabacteroides TaxID=2649774 RepID=UPI0013D66448|nr:MULTISPECIES: metallophosphoesterase family protein [unclassified Parabacteroides]MDH6533700.1 3',5'-cyclic AMP phosphodiesterase CpdA [Parabacteroides sp. PM5-20]NDV54452.1 metallophosphatase [Parabacteroides sp. 52]